MAYRARKLSEIIQGWFVLNTMTVGSLSGLYNIEVVLLLETNMPICVSKTADFIDFRDFRKMHEADQHGRPRQIGAATFPPRKRTFWKRFKKFDTNFQHFRGISAWFSSTEI